MQAAVEKIAGGCSPLSWLVIDGGHWRDDANESDRRWPAVYQQTRRCDRGRVLRDHGGGLARAARFAEDKAAGGGAHGDVVVHRTAEVPRRVGARGGYDGANDDKG